VTIGGQDDWKGYEDIFIFAQQGPISFTKLPDLSVELPASTGCSKARCRVSLSVTCQPRPATPSHVVDQIQIAPRKAQGTHPCNEDAMNCGKCGAWGKGWHPGTYPSLSRHDSYLHLVLPRPAPILCATVRDQRGVGPKSPIVSHT
jgi:hypothetical protein